VGKDSVAGFQTLQEAIDHAPPTGEVIRIEPGRYREKVSITKENIHLIGIGKQPQDVVVSWADSAMNTGSTFKSGTMTVRADGFAAENLTIENTWEVENPQQDHRSQAVALQLSSDRAVLDRVRLLGFQDTLYANSLTCQSKTLDAPCQASRQFFNDCYIEGHVDYIFGDARAVFNNCELHSHRHSSVMITAQSRISPLEDSGYYFLHCRITGETSTDKVFFGRPWRDFATVLFYDTDIEQTLYADGWAEWDGRLKTATYREYASHGPGVNGGYRVVEYPPLSSAEEKGLTPSLLLSGADHWDPTAAVTQLREIR
jgi:pectin methylesterase-like acyl-CoA thioesterase